MRRSTSESANARPDRERRDDATRETGSVDPVAGLHGAVGNQAVQRQRSADRAGEGPETGRSPGAELCPRCARRYRAGKPLDCSECEAALARAPGGKDGTALQPKLRVSQPSDPAEREAERVAEAVVRAPEAQSTGTADDHGAAPVETGDGSGTGTADAGTEGRAETVGGRGGELAGTVDASAGERPGAGGGRADRPRIRRRADGRVGGIQRLCSRCRRRHRQGRPLDCEDCETAVQRSPADGGAGTGAADPERAVAAARGAGRALPDGVRSFFESRFGRDFSDVRVHTGPRVDRATEALGARAYTVGRDVYLRSGEYRPESRSGKRLLAHELTHVVQQTGGGTAAGAPRPRATPSVGHRAGEPVMRKLDVERPGQQVPEPSGSGVDWTNRETAQNYLNRLCAAGVTVSRSGEVSAGPGACAASTTTPTGCSCICDMVDSANQWTIRITDTTWPHTTFDDPQAAHGRKPGGSGGVVVAPSPNSPTEWGAATESGRKLVIDPWLVLGHELCGHAWLGDQGNASTTPRGEGGHQPTVDRENKIRREHGIPERGDFRDPYCGESFYRTKGSSDVTWSSYLEKCKQWRREYNRKHGTSYSIDEEIPAP